MTTEITDRTVEPAAPAAASGRPRREAFALAARLLVASVWLVHGLYNKLLHGSPRHLAIVQSVPGLAGVRGEHVLTAVGVGEVLIALWVISRGAPRLCAAVQAIGLLSMNALELAFAPHLLLWPAGLVPVNLAFLGLAWFAQDPAIASRILAALRRHPIAMQARLEHCLTLTYALPAHVLRPLLPPGLELETRYGFGFVAIALVQARSLRPVALPEVCGQDFVLSGYRVFTTFRPPARSAIRGLRILRSDANRALMVVGGNLLTHYHYHRCSARIETTSHWLRVAIRTADGAGDLDVRARLTSAALPEGSPFGSLREARRFAGPLPYTFDYERETDAVIAIEAYRTNWRPVPVDVDTWRVSFFNAPALAGCTPILAAAFYVDGVDYRWKRGVRYPLTAAADGARA